MTEISTVCVVTPHQSTYPYPIRFKMGEILVVGRQDDKFPGWIWTRTANANEGWAPMEILAVHGKTATATEDYIATELTTSPGEQLSVHRKLAGWLWVERATGECGWVPEHTTKPA